ncbi:hypothetical protein NOL65_19870 [Vibrio parahaemolyticus]|uniref:hypothetical protein n=1 Tax=Vibrio parahaemolyticus TaxID=670 RepID=UPI00226B8097|nr:hypothetical protein [Vibrio parahaemolyticus]MCX8914779.1 hypothetical protein [Vibrio parahaemolyticus]
MSDEFQYQRKPKFNIGDTVLCVFNVYDLAEYGLRLVYEGKVEEIKIIATCNNQRQKYELKYRISIPAEWHQPTVSEDELFSLEERKHARNLALHRAEQALHTAENKLAKAKAVLKNIGIKNED